MKRHNFASDQSLRPKVDRSVSTSLFFDFSPKTIAGLVKSGCSFLYLMTNDPQRLADELVDVLKNFSAIREQQNQEEARQYMTFSWGDKGLFFCSGNAEMELVELYFGDNRAATLKSSMKNFLTSEVPMNKRLDADAYNIVLNATDVFSDTDVTELMAKAILNNDNDRNVVRKMFFLVGSTPYLPSALNGLAAFMRHDYGVAERKLIDSKKSQEVLSMYKNFCRTMNFPNDVHDNDVLAVIENLTEMEAQNIITYVLVNERKMDIQKIRQFRDNIDLQNNMFSFVG